MGSSHSPGDVGLAFGLVLAAGFSTAIGAATVFCTSFAKRSFLAGALGASAGVMLYVSFAEIFSAKSIPGFVEAGYTDNEATRYATFCFFGGMLFIWLLDKLVHAMTHLGSMFCKWWSKRKVAGSDPESLSVTEPSTASSTAPASALTVEADPEAPSDVVPGVAESSALTPANAMDRSFITICEDSTHLRAGLSPDAMVMVERVPTAEMSRASLIHDHHEETVQIPKGEPEDMGIILNADSHARLARTGVLTALALGLHNFPEGLATFVGTLADPTAGVAIAIAIALHNIPEGVAVAMPIYYSSGSKWKGFLWGCVSGISEPFGALLGYAILRGSDADPIMYALMFGLVAGMMVYISLVELLPTALRFDPDGVYTSRGLVAGMAVMAGSLLLFGI